MATLSAKARELLTLVGDHTEWEGDERPGTTLRRYFIPTDHGKSEYSTTLQRRVIVSGGGDAASFRALERKGLIRKERTATYAYSITEDGLLALAKAEGR